jgi:hypothetical protein
MVEIWLQASVAAISSANAILDGRFGIFPPDVASQKISEWQTSKSLFRDFIPSGTGLRQLPKAAYTPSG